MANRIQSHVELRQVEQLSPELIASLTTGFAFDDYRRMAAIAPSAAAAYRAEQITAAGSAADTVRLVAFDISTGAPAGLLLLQRLPYDTDLFGIPMAGIPQLLVRPDHPDPESIWQALLAELPRLAQAHGYKHISTRVDSADITGYHALAAANFRLMETLVSMAHDTKRRGTGTVDPADFGFDGSVREVEQRDVEALAELASKSFGLNRYHLDKHLPERQAGHMMAQWIRNYCADQDDHQVWVAEHTGGGIAGFLGHALNRQLEKHSGVLVSGRALLAVENPRSRVGQLLSRAHTWQSRGDFKEADTQLNNYGMIKVSFNLDMDMVRTKYSFHCWFGD